MLRTRRVRSRRGTMVWSPSSVQRLFANRVYVGEITFGAYSKADAHPALVDLQTFRLAQHQPVARAEPPKPGLLYDIARCASCSACLTINSGGLFGHPRV